MDENLRFEHAYHPEEPPETCLHDWRAGQCWSTAVFGHMDGGSYRFFPNTEERWEPLKRMHAVDPELCRRLIRRELAEGDKRDVGLIELVKSAPAPDASSEKFDEWVRTCRKSYTP